MKKGNGKRLLIVEDDKEISQMLTSFLVENGYQVDCAYNGMEASAVMKQGKYDLILMDLMLPYKSGDDLIKELRTDSDVPVIVLSARSMMETRLEVLRLGADDYIMKPFDLDEVLVRIEVVLRRSGKKLSEKLQQLTCRDLILDVEGNRVVVKGHEVLLTAKELSILKLLLENPEKTFTKANLFETIWGEPYYQEDNTLNVHMSNLRSKLKKAGNGEEYIETVWGIGYRVKRDG
ncbi:MAG: response regulator transcription factor [Lachnospiraceae bacterium]